MADNAKLHELCLNEHGAVMPKPECRAAIINHLILEELIDIDEAEDQADHFLRASELWPSSPAPTESTGSE